jgi:Carboxypeptidase regulatory-like domain
MNSFFSGLSIFNCVSIRKASAILATVFAVILICFPLFSQGNFGRILGTITDQSGGVVAGATVTVLDVDRGVSRTLTSDDAGEYNAPNLQPGKYTVRAEAKGFKTVERQNVILEVGKEPRVDLTLQPGEQTQTLTVTESIPLVETTNATLGGTLNNAAIQDLPLNGRDYQNLMGLRPGVMLQPGGGPWTQSTNGVRPDESVWMVDGVINANFFDARPVAGMPSPFMDAATILPIDAIQEFNLMENPKAEYGWKPGAVVNVGIKSGTNILHGSAYAFGRTDAWDARNYFNIPPSSGTCPLGGGSPLSACNKTPVQLKQFGGVVGGPIKKDKLFFFAGYEGARSSIGSDLVATVPQSGPASDGNPANNMNAAIADLIAHGVAVSAVSRAIAGCPPGGCNNSGLLPDTGPATSFLSTFPNVNQSDNGIAKIDYHLNQKNTIFGTFYYGRYSAVGEDHPFVNQLFTDNAPIKTLSDVESWVYTPNSTVVNELRFGYDRTSFNFVNVDINNPANGTGIYSFINTGAPTGGFPNIVISGFGPGQTLGTALNRPQFNSPNPYYDFQDAVSYLKDKHTLKFGGEFTHIEADSTIVVAGRGQFTFTGGRAFAGSSPLEDFFAGTPLSGNLLSGNPAIKATWTSTAGFIQDDWRVTPKVIVNLGLRYEYVSPMKASNNSFGSFDPTQGMVQQGGAINTVWKGDHRAFGPRVGFAWDVTGKGTTVVRGGVSLIHSSWPLLTWDGEFGLQTDGSTSLAAVPTGAAFQCASVASGSPLTNKCPAGGGGTIGLGALTFLPPTLCWDAGVRSGPAFTAACASGQKTIFPVSPALCGDGAPNPSHVTGFDAVPCDVMGADPNLRSPYVVNYNVSLQHQFGANFSLEVSYVGDHGYDLLNFHDINQAPLGAGWCLNALTPAQSADACGPNITPGSYNATATQEARPFYSKFPYLGFINFANNASHSMYNSAQVTLTKRMSQGLSFTAGYTYAHGLDNGSLNRFGGLPQNSNDTAAEYSSSDFDIRHRATFTVTYNLPGKKGFGQLLEGWQINSIVNLQTAQPWAAWDAGSNISGTGENADRWDIVGSGDDFSSGKDSIPYCNGFTTGVNTPANVTCTVTSIYGGASLSAAQTTSAINGCVANAPSVATLASFGCYASANGKSFLVPPALGQFGNMGRNIFRDSGLKNWDFSVFKNFSFRERFGAQFRWEVFNVLNRPTAANPYGASSFVNAGNGLQGGGPLGYSGLTPDFAAGNPLVGSGSQRVMQLGLKLTF